MHTVGEMIERGLSVRWACTVCRAYGMLDLHAVVKAVGPDATLTNRRPPCKLCPGRVRFEDATNVYPRPMDTIRQGSIGYWAFQDAERERLYKLGWKVFMGQWVRPEREKPASG